MSLTYKQGDRVPSEVLCVRLQELANCIGQGPDAVRREFTMRVPAELDRDADIVICEAARRIMKLEEALKDSLRVLGGFEMSKSALTNALESGREALSGSRFSAGGAAYPLTWDVKIEAIGGGGGARPETQWPNGAGGSGTVKS